MQERLTSPALLFARVAIRLLPYSIYDDKMPVIFAPRHRRQLLITGHAVEDAYAMTAIKIYDTAEGAAGRRAGRHHRLIAAERLERAACDSHAGSSRTLPREAGSRRW